VAAFNDSEIFTVCAGACVEDRPPAHPS
jgi:hypothetical protein